MLSLTYVSSATELLDPSQLSGMLAAFRPKNQARDISGLLLYSGGNIIQTIEGPDAAVDSTYADIAADPRHRDVLVLLREPIAERGFAGWAMGFRPLSPADCARVDGYSDFLHHSEGTDTVAHPNASLRLLEMFRTNMR